VSEERPVVTVGPPAHGGHCVARLDGRVVFVRHAIEGEEVVLDVTDRRSRFWRADAVEILAPAAERVPSVWPEAGPGGVGGGELAHVALPAQRAWKARVLADTLRRIGGEEVAADVAAVRPQGVDVEALPGDDDGLATRTRIELTVDRAGLAGMHRFRSHDVLALAAMPLAAEGITGLELLGAGSPWRPTWAPGARVQAVAPSAGDPLVLVDGEPAARRRTGPPRRNVRERVGTSLGELTYRVGGAGFWQVHRAAPATLVDAVLEAAAPRPGERVLELYAGAGLLSLPLALAVGPAGGVLTVEGAADAVRDARRNLHDQPWATLHHGRVDPAAVAAGAGADVVVLDPPRTGAGPGVMAAVAALGADRVVHVACDPAALARDLRAARDHGYVPTAVRAFDLFPHTHHFEVVVTLRRP
jgi:tRNA/tmRNA/rRNA uracil-C5-methylase (TrmA/RlmC/RlmD family)